MQIVYHIGAHCTDDWKIQTCLARNRGLLAREGIIVPNPGRFRPILRETLKVLKGDAATREVQELMLDSILTQDHPERLIFSNEAFLGGLQRALTNDTLYHDAAEKCRNLHNLFHDQEVEFYLGIRNPATFLPACFARMGGDSFEAYLAQIDPLSIRWSDVVERIHTALPTATLKVWSNEDTPFIWHELIRDIADCDNTTQLVGLDDYLSSIMLEEGLDRMEAYLETHPPSNEIQRRRILGAFLDKFEIEDETAEVAAPVWTNELIENLTDIYEEDLFAIERMPGVQFISP